MREKIVNDKIRRLHKPQSNKYQKLNNPSKLKDYSLTLDAGKNGLMESLIFTPITNLIYYSHLPFVTVKPNTKKGD
jgi:hypothetical protein